MTAPLVVRAAVPADLEHVAQIYAHYVTTSVATFEEVPPAVADWRRRLDDLADRNLPFLVAGADAAVRAVGRKHGRWIDTILMQRELG